MGLLDSRGESKIEELFPETLCLATARELAITEGRVVNQFAQRQLDKTTQLPKCTNSDRANEELAELFAQGFYVDGPSAEEQVDDGRRNPTQETFFTSRSSPVSQSKEEAQENARREKIGRDRFQEKISGFINPVSVTDLHYCSTAIACPGPKHPEQVTTLKSIMARSICSVAELRETPAIGITNSKVWELRHYHLTCGWWHYNA